MTSQPANKRTFAFTIPETRFTRAILISFGRRVDDGKRSFCIVAYSARVSGFRMLMLTEWLQPVSGSHFGYAGE